LIAPIEDKPRSSNLVAQGLVAMGCKLGLGTILVLDSILDCIHVQLANDLASLIA